MSSLSHRLPYGRLPSWQTDSASDLAYHGTQSAYVLGETFLDEGSDFRLLPLTSVNAPKGSADDQYVTEEDDHHSAYAQTTSKAPEQSLEDAEPPSRYSKWGLQTGIWSWSKEIFAMTLSIACFVAIVGLLFGTQGRLRSTWTFRYLPNSVISQIMTVCRSALMLSTASCIGQITWLHFQKKARNLHEIQVIDDASRGPWGAIVLLSSGHRFGLAATIGCVITLGTLLMEPFTQQAFTLPLRQTLTPLNGSYPVLQIYAPAPNAVLGNVENQVTSGSPINVTLQAAIVDSFYGKTLPPIYNCPAASCSWPDYASLGLYSSCLNVTATTKSNCSYGMEGAEGTTCEYITPGGFQLSTLFWDDSEEETIATLVNVTTTTFGEPRVNNSAIEFATVLVGYGEADPQITECSIALCAHVYQNVTAQGTDFSIGNLETFLLHAEGIWWPGNDIGHGADYMAYTAIGDFPEDLNNTFTVQYANFAQLGSFLAEVLEACSLTQYSGTLPTSLPFSLGGGLLSNPSVGDMAATLATSLTEAMRNLSGTNALGTSYTEASFMQVRWSWLALPATVILLATLLLILTICQNQASNTYIWKSSPLALLFHPLQNWAPEEVDMGSLGMMEKLAKSLDGQLVDQGNGQRGIVRVQA